MIRKTKHHLLSKTSPHLHLNVGLSVAATGLVAGVRIAALALQAALRGRSEGWEVENF